MNHQVFQMILIIALLFVSCSSETLTLHVRLLNLAQESISFFQEDTFWEDFSPCLESLNLTRITQNAEQEQIHPYYRIRSLYEETQPLITILPSQELALTLDLPTFFNVSLPGDYFLTIEPPIFLESQISQVMFDAELTRMEEQAVIWDLSSKMRMNLEEELFNSSTMYTSINISFRVNDHHNYTGLNIDFRSFFENSEDEVHEDIKTAKFLDGGNFDKDLTDITDDDDDSEQSKRMLSSLKFAANMSTWQRSIIRKALGHSQFRVRLGLNHLLSLSATTATMDSRFTTWFGSNAPYDVVLQKFIQLETKLNDLLYVVYQWCYDKDYYEMHGVKIPSTSFGFVEHSKSTTQIFLCQASFQKLDNVQIIGNRAMSNLLLHESCHLAWNAKDAKKAGTKYSLPNYEYTAERSCKDLAKLNAPEAYENPSNFKWFIQKEFPVKFELYNFLGEPCYKQGPRFMCGSLVPPTQLYCIDYQACDWETSAGEKLTIDYNTRVVKFGTPDPFLGPLKLTSVGNGAFFVEGTKKKFLQWTHNSVQFKSMDSGSDHKYYWELRVNNQPALTRNVSLNIVNFDGNYHWVSLREAKNGETFGFRRSDFFNPPISQKVYLEIFGPNNHCILRTRNPITNQLFFVTYKKGALDYPLKLSDVEMGAISLLDQQKETKKGPSSNTLFVIVPRYAHEDEVKISFFEELQFGGGFSHFFEQFKFYDDGDWGSNDAYFTPNWVPPR